MTDKAHHWPIRVYYEDTDLAGIVYYANYFRFTERARTEWIRSLGVDQALLKAESGMVFVVARVEADYLKPARFDDEIEVVTRVEGVGGTRINLSQNVVRDGVVLFRSRVVLVIMNDAGRAVRPPAEIRRKLENLVS